MALLKLFFIVKDIHLSRQNVHISTQTLLDMHLDGIKMEYKNTLKIEKTICIKKKLKFKFDKFNIIYENL